MTILHDPQHERNASGMTRMVPSIPPTRGRCRGKWLFLWTFIFACFLFWWLPSIIFRAIAHMEDPVEDRTIAISVLALIMFVAGYLLPMRSHPTRRLPTSLFDDCKDLAFQATVYLGIPAFILAVQFFGNRAGADYGTGTGISALHQAVLYAHMFFGLMYIGAASPETDGRKRMLVATALTILPRLIVSLHWGRFFLAQAVVPILFIAVCRGWIRFSPKRIFQLAALALALIFVPALTRGDRVTGQGEMVSFFAAGSTLRLFQDNVDLNLNGRCPPLLVSMTAKIVPYHAMGVCVIDLWGMQGLPASLDRLLAFNEPGSAIDLVGPGSNYLLELFLSGGILATMAGSAFFGISCRLFITWIGKGSLFAGIWAECLTRALLAPRGNLGYIYERVPSLVLSTLLIVLMLSVWRLVKKEHGFLTEHGRKLPREGRNMSKMWTAPRVGPEV